MKVFPYLKKGDNTFVFSEKNLVTTNGSKVTILNVVIHWRFENVDKDTFVKLTDQAGTGTNISFGQGYWSFDDIKTRLGEKGVRLERIYHNNTCRVHAESYTVNLGDIGLLQGFVRGEFIRRGSSKDSGRERVNQRLEYVTLSCDLVDNEKVVDRYGEPSQIVAVLSVDTSQRLNGTFTKLEDACFTAPIGSGSFKKIRFTIQDNVPSSLVKLYLSCECEIK